MKRAKQATKKLYRTIFMTRKSRTFAVHEVYRILQDDHKIFLNDASITRAWRRYPQVIAIPPQGPGEIWRYYWSEKSPD